jgi:hypothetical protein
LQSTRPVGRVAELGSLGVLRVMASNIQCVCGSLVHTNLFSGAKVYSLIRDDEYDQMSEPNAPDAASRLFLGGREVFRCSTCLRLIVFWDRSPTCRPTFYAEEHHNFERPDA